MLPDKMTAILENAVENAAPAQRQVPLPGSNQVPTGTSQRVSFQDLLCELVVRMPGSPKEFKAAEGKMASLGFYGSGKVELGGMRFQVQVSAQVVKSNEMQPGAERSEVKRKLGLLA